MRLFPVNNPMARGPSPLIKGTLLAGVLLLLSSAAQAQTSGLTPEQQKQLSTGFSSSPASGARPGVAPNPRRSSASSSSASYSRPVDNTGVAPMSQDEYDRLAMDRDTPQHHAEQLALKAKRQRDLEKNLDVPTENDDSMPPPPQDIEELQNVGDGAESKGIEDAADKSKDSDIDVAFNLRRDAQKEAALSFGARGGLAKRNFQIMERLKGFEATMDQVFNFRALLVKAPSGMLIEPPIVRESIDSMVITQGGSEAAVSDRIYDISKQAKIVSTARDWRQYLIQAWVSRVPKPPRLLWPKTKAEQDEWNDWVAEGWRAGTAQADAMFEANLNRLVADYNGMVRYRTLLTQGMVSQPYAMHEDRGVTGSKTVMRVGDRALRITGPSQFLTGSELWKPADR